LLKKFFDRFAVVEDMDGTAVAKDGLGRVDVDGAIEGRQDLGDSVGMV
jgi:hypothetical protein